MHQKHQKESMKWINGKLFKLDTKKKTQYYKVQIQLKKIKLWQF